MHALTTYWKRVHGSYLNDTQLEQMSSLDDMLVGCSFCYNTCTSSQFQFIYHPLYLNCYRFNSGFNASQQPTELSTVINGGIVNSLTIDLYAGLSDSQNYADNLLFKVSFSSKLLCKRNHLYICHQNEKLILVQNDTTCLQL